MTWNLVTFANENFYDRQNYLEKYAEKLGMGSYSYTHEWLKKQDFYEENKNILQDETGLGYFLWKAYIIDDAIKKMEDGDVLFYTDVGDIFTPSLVQYVESIMEDDPCLLIKGNFKNKEWTRRDCFVYMDCDEEDYWESPQLEGGMSFWRVCDQSKEIIAEWLKFASDRRIVSDDENVCGKDNFPTFKEHRWDQSILTNLAVKNGLSVAPEDIRGYIECNYDYWYERYANGGAPIYRPVDKFLQEKKDELMGLYNA